LTRARKGWLRGIRVESSRCKIEGNDVVVAGEPAMVVKMVSLALETEAEVVEPVAGGRSEKKVRDGYVVICKVWATVERRS
jgi:hypothetical protein